MLNQHVLINKTIINRGLTTIPFLALTLEIGYILKEGINNLDWIV